MEIKNVFAQKYDEIRRLDGIEHFSFTFYNKFDDTYQFIPCKKAYYVERQDFFQKIV